MCINTCFLTCWFLDIVYTFSFYLNTDNKPKPVERCPTSWNTPSSFTSTVIYYLLGVEIHAERANTGPDGIKSAQIQAAPLSNLYMVVSCTKVYCLESKHSYLECHICPSSLRMSHVFGLLYHHIWRTWSDVDCHPLYNIPICHTGVEFGVEILFLTDN